MSDITADAPTVTDDLGDGRSGTRWGEAYNTQLLAALNIQCLSATNPSLTPADTIDEVVTARDAYASLDARLDDLTDALGITNLASITQLLGGIGAINLVTNDDDMVWPDGDTSAPEGETLSGASAAVLRCGTGLSDTTRKIGDFCARLTRGADNAKLTQSLLSGSAFIRAEYIIGSYAAAGCWINCSTPNAARIGVYDGVGYSYSDYHTGGGDWEWLAVTRQINVAADRLQYIRAVDGASVDAYFSGRTLMLLSENLTLTGYSPCPVVLGSFHVGVGGNASVASEIGAFTPGRPGYVKYVQLRAKTAPVGANLIVDVNTWNGSSLASMFSSQPAIIDGANNAGAAPDGTYARRCFRASYGATLTTGGLMTLDVDQVGSGTAGAGLSAEVRTIQYATPLERFLDAS